MSGKVYYKDLETSPVKQFSVYTQLFMKGGGSKNKLAVHNDRANQATPESLGMLSDSFCNKIDKYQTCPCMQF